MSQTTQMVPLEGLVLIHDGEFMEQADAAFVQVLNKVRLFCRAYPEYAEKCKGQIKIVIDVGCTDREQGIYPITAKFERKLPEHPGMTTVAIDSFDQEGKPAMLIRHQAGDDDPRQQRIPIDDE